MKEKIRLNKDRFRPKGTPPIKKFCLQLRHAQGTPSVFQSYYPLFIEQMKLIGTNDFHLRLLPAVP